MDHNINTINIVSYPCFIVNRYKLKTKNQFWPIETGIILNEMASIFSASPVLNQGYPNRLSTIVALIR